MKINEISKDVDTLTGEIFFRAWVEYPFCSFYHKTPYCIPVFGKTEQEVKLKVAKAIKDKSLIDEKRHELRRAGNLTKIDDYSYLLNTK